MQSSVSRRRHPAPSPTAHRLTALPPLASTGPRWSCACGRLFTDPQLAAQHGVDVRPRDPWSGEGAAS